MNLFLGERRVEMSISICAHCEAENGGVNDEKGIQCTEDTSDYNLESAWAVQRSLAAYSLKFWRRAERRCLQEDYTFASATTIAGHAIHTPNGLRIINSLFPRLVVISLSSSLPT